MKRFFAAITVIFACLTLFCACRDNTDPTTSVTENSSPDEPKAAWTARFLNVGKADSDRHGDKGFLFRFADRF